MKIIQNVKWLGTAWCPRCELRFEEIEPELLIGKTENIRCSEKFSCEPAIICPKCLKAVFIHDPQFIPLEYIEKFVEKRYYFDEEDDSEYWLSHRRSFYQQLIPAQRISESEEKFLIEKINEQRKKIGLKEMQILL